MSPKDYLDFAEKFVNAIEKGDVATVRASYWPDAKIWHNTDNVEQTIDQNVAILEWFIRTLPDRHYRIVRREALADGFLQQHVLEATLPNGEKWSMDACCVIRMKDGKITRLDEYIDSAKGALLRPFGR